MAVKEKKKIKKTIRDKKIKKTKQKGGLQQDIPSELQQDIPGVLQDYFTFFLNLLNIYNEAYKPQKINTSKINTLKKNYQAYYTEFEELTINYNINDIINSIIKILTLLFSIKTINEKDDDFISKILKIYRHKLFIDFLNKDYKNEEIIKRSFEILSSIPKLGKSFIDSFLSNNNKISSFIRKIRKLFLEGFKLYFEKVPVIYGGKIKIDVEQNNNVPRKINTPTRNLNRNRSQNNKQKTYVGYNEYICKIVGIFSKKKRVFIINPLVALIYELLSLINNNYNNYDYKTILSKLIYKLLKLDVQSVEEFPKIEYLEKGKKFCIIKEEQDEKINSDKCSFAFGCSLGMTAEIREENLPSDEDIFEFLFILLRISIENKDILTPSRNKLQNLRPIQRFNIRNIYQQQKQQIMNQNNAELKNLQAKLRNAISEINTELKKTTYLPREINRLVEKKNSLITYLREIS